MGRKPQPAQYEGVLHHLPRSVLEAHVRLTAKVILIRYDKPTDKGKAVGSRIVKGWTREACEAQLWPVTRELVAVDKFRRTEEKTGKIRRLEAENITLE